MLESCRSSPTHLTHDTTMPAQNGSDDAFHASTANNRPLLYNMQNVQQCKTARLFTAVTVAESSRAKTAGLAVVQTAAIDSTSRLLDELPSPSGLPRRFPPHDVLSRSSVGLMY